MGIIKRLLSGSNVHDSSSSSRPLSSTDDWIPDAIEFSAASSGGGVGRGDDGGGGGSDSDDDHDDDDHDDGVSNLSETEARSRTIGKKKNEKKKKTKKEKKETSSSSGRRRDDGLGGGKGGRERNDDEEGGEEDVVLREGKRQFECTMEEFERRLTKIKNSSDKFASEGGGVGGDEDEDDDDDDDSEGGSGGALSEIVEEEDYDVDGGGRGRKGSGARGGRTQGMNDEKKTKKKSSSSSSFGLGKFFGGGKKGRGRRRRGGMDDDDEDFDDDDDDDDDGELYISGECDGEFDNAGGYVVARDAANYAGTRRSSRPSSTGRGNTAAISAAAASGMAGIGVPQTGTTRMMTPARLEDELYRYKLETLNLTDACRDLAEQLEEVEGRLGSVQAQATFRIHALEAELQDGNVGLKSLVRMTSVEMDGRLDALRALGKTTAIQAAKLKERDHELISMEGRMRRTRRDVKNLKREHRKVCDERSYLRERLEELDAARCELEEGMKSLAAENAAIITGGGSGGATAASLAEREAEIQGVREELNDALEQVGRMMGQLREKDGKVLELRDIAEEKEGEIMELRDELDKKEHEVVRVENQLEKVRIDLLEAANAARTAEEARVEAEGRESKIRHELEETLAVIEDTAYRVAVLESQETELKNQLARAKMMEEEVERLEEQKARLAELEQEVEALREEKASVLAAMNDAQKSHVEAIADREAQIDSLNQDVDVHREQMELAQTMLEEKEMLAIELRNQLEEAMTDEELRVRELEQNLAAKSREVNNIAMELEERNKYVDTLENKLTKIKREFIEYRAELEAAAESSELATINEADEGDGEIVLSMASTRTANAANTTQITVQMTELAEKEALVERLERELRTNKRQVEQLSVELDEKDKHSELLKAELERRKARVEEVEAQLDERDKNIKSLNNELISERQSLDAVVEKLKNLQIDLHTAKEDAKAATGACEQAESRMQAAEQARQHAIGDLENLKSEIESLQKDNKCATAEVEKIKADAEKEKKSGMQAAATLAATNAARQAEMEMSIEKMQKEMGSKKREIDAIKAELSNKGETAEKLSAALHEAREELLSYKEGIESKKEEQALERVSHQDYFEESDDLSGHAASTSDSNLMGRSHGGGGGLFGGLFNRSNIDLEGDHVDWKVRALEKDKRISELEQAVSANSLTTANLKNELMLASSKFKEDESQRRLLIQRLENENQAYSIKVEALETEFEEIRKRKEAQTVAYGRRSSQDDDGSVASSVASNVTGAASILSSAHSEMTGVTSITGKSRLTPLERDNKKLKKQKRVYESRITSLQTQLSDIQQIVPELMTKSKSQIQKLELVVETQRQASQERERSLTEEIAHLRQQNEQLQAATRVRLQSSNVGRQDEIDQLKMRLEVREATIKKLEMMSSSGKFSRVKGVPMRKKKKKATNGQDDNDGEMSSVISATDSAFSAI